MPGTSTVSRIKSLADRSPDTSTIAVVGGGLTGCSLAATLRESGHVVRFLDESRGAVERARTRDVEAHEGSPIEREGLALIDPGTVDVAIVADAADERTALAAQLLRTAFDCRAIAVLVTDPENLDAIEDMDLDVVTMPDVLARELEPITDAVGVEREGG